MNSENVNLMNDEELEELFDTLNKENKDNESIQSMYEAKEKSADELRELLDEEAETSDTSSEVDPESGQPTGTHVSVAGWGMGRKENLFDDFLGMADDELKPSSEADTDITESHVSKAMDSKDLKADFVTTEKVKELILKRNRGERIKYSELPEVLKEQVNQTVAAALGRGYISPQIKTVRNMMADDIIESFYSDIITQKIDKEVVDLDTSIKNLAKTAYVDVNSDQRKQHFNTFVIKFPPMAEKIKDTDPEKAKIMLEVSEGFKQAHTMEDMYAAYGNSKIRVRRIDVEKLDKTIRRFNYKYENSTMVIRDISSAVDVLSRHVNKRISLTAIKTFVAIICKYCENMKPSNLAEHTFMYYLINNILSLDIPFTNEADIVWNDEFLNNINKFLTLIEERNFK